MNVSLAVLLELILQVGGTRPPLDQEAKARAQVLLTEGTALFEHGDSAAALNKFETAYGIYRSPKLQFNIGQAKRELGRPVEALESFEKFLAEAPNASADTRTDARKAIEEIQMTLGRLRIDCATKGTSVAVDGKPIGLAPLAEPIWATPGRHQVTGRLARFTPATEEVEVIAGQIRTVTLGLQPSSVASSPTPSVPSPIITAPGSPDISSSPAAATLGRGQYQTYFWTGVAVTAASVIGAAVAWSSASSKYHELESSCGRSPPCSENQIGEVKTRVNITNVLWVVAGTAAAATGLVFYLDRRESNVSVAWRF